MHFHLVLSWDWCWFGYYGHIGLYNSRNSLYYLIPPSLHDLYENDKIIFFIDMKQAIHRGMSKLNRLYNEEKNILVNKRIRNGAG